MIKSLPQRLNIDELLLICPFNDSRGGGGDLSSFTHPFSSSKGISQGEGQAISTSASDCLMKSEENIKEPGVKILLADISEFSTFSS